MKKNKKSGLKIYIVVPAIVGFVCVAAIVAALVLGVPAKVNAARIGKQLDLGNKYLASADYDNAEVTFNKALKIDPKSVEAATGMAKVYNEKKQPEKALEYVEKASDNLANPVQAQELQVVYNDTKTQLEENTGKSSDANKKSFSKIEKVIDTVMLTPTPTEEPEETVTPTPTEGADDGPDFDDNKNNGANGGGTEDSNTGGENKNDEEKDDNDKKKEDGNTGEGNGTDGEDEPDGPTIIPDPSKDITPKPGDETTTDGIIPLTGEDILTPTPTITPTPTPTVIPDVDNGSAANAGDNNNEETMDNDDDDEDTGDEEDEDTSWNNNNNTDDDDDTDEGDTGNNSETGGGEGPGEEMQEATVSPEELLNNYENDTLPSEIPYGNFSGSSISYTYGDGASAAAAVSGRITETQRDLDGDGIPELLVVEMQSGKIAFRIYKVNNGNVEITASQTISAGMETAVESVSYGSTQTCFLMNNNGTYEVGLASYCYGYDVGEETPAVRTYAEVYSVAGDGSVSLCASGSVQNGEGQDGFSASLVPAGMSGSWNSSNAETLQSMGYADDPYQDAAGVPNPLSGGVSEAGAETLAVVDAQMAAGSGELTIR